MFRTFGSRTIRELRKKQGLTAQELALLIKVNSTLIKKIDHLQYKKVPEPLKSRIKPILKGR